MTGFPYVPWFHGDFLRSTAGWTPLERYSYFMLLCAQFEMGPLPNDLVRLAGIVGIDAAELANIWPLISRKFKTTTAGLVNPRMKEHKAKCLRHHARLSAAGKKGMGSRWGNRSGKVVDLHPRNQNT